MHARPTIKVILKKLNDINDKTIWSNDCLLYSYLLLIFLNKYINLIFLFFYY